jgi:hypothetical protein
MRHLHRPLVVAALLALAPTIVAAQQSTPAGRVKVVTGSASIVRAGAAVPAEPGQPVFEHDTLRTGADGRIGITLKDDTRVSVGPGSEVRLDNFLYAPENGRLALALQFVRGVAVYVSGQIAKLAPDAVRLDTPAATLGVRGTTLAIRVSE